MPKAPDAGMALKAPSREAHSLACVGAYDEVAATGGVVMGGASRSSRLMGVAAGAAAGGESDVASASLRPSNENSFFGSSSVHERTLMLPSVAVATQDGCASGALLAGLVAADGCTVVEGS